MGPTWGPPGYSRPQMGPILAPRSLLLGEVLRLEPCNPPEPETYPSSTWNLHQAKSTRINPLPLGMRCIYRPIRTTMDPCWVSPQCHVLTHHSIDQPEDLTVNGTFNSTLLNEKYHLWGMHSEIFLSGWSKQRGVAFCLVWHRIGQVMT